MSWFLVLTRQLGGERGLLVSRGCREYVFAGGLGLGLFGLACGVRRVFGC